MDDTTTRKLTMLKEARATVNAIEDQTPAKPRRERVSVEEALQTQMLVSQAHIDIMIAKGFFTEEELLERIQEIRKG
jgi:hypothetical protein